MQRNGGIYIYICTHGGQLDAGVEHGGELITGGREADTDRMRTSGTRHR